MLGQFWVHKNDDETKPKPRLVLPQVARVMIILLFPSSTSLSNQNIVNQNYIENEALVSTLIVIFGIYTLRDTL